LGGGSKDPQEPANVVAVAHALDDGAAYNDAVGAKAPTASL
jgi:hypothetical protein